MHLRRSQTTPDLIVRPLRRRLMGNSSPEKPIIQEQNGVFATFRETIVKRTPRHDEPHDVREFCDGGRASAGNAYFSAPLRGGTSCPLTAWLSADPFDVALRGALAGSPFHGDLRRSSRLWAQRLSRLCSGPCTVCETGHGERHGFGHGEARIPALLSRRA